MTATTTKLQNVNPDKFLALITGILLSLVSAYYAITGLAIIFAGAFIPVVIMGSILEFGKIITASYLYRNWKQLPVLMRSYFCIAVTILMFITSMGVFGFLSKAHVDQNLAGAEVSSKVAIIDEKIKVAKENIEVNRKALKQMDEIVNQTISRSTTEDGATRASLMRRQQTRERNGLISEIEKEQKTLSLLNEERAPLAAEIRKVDAEVGPIRYVAELLYDKNSPEILDKAVRFMIMALVLVLDPLALLLIISANVRDDKQKNNSVDKYDVEAEEWLTGRANAVATNGNDWKELNNVTVTRHFTKDTK